MRQARLSNEEILECITEAINRGFEGPGRLQFPPEQVEDMFGGPKVIEHLEPIIDGFDAYIDQVDGTTLEVKMGADDEAEFPSPPPLDASEILSTPYLLPNKDGDNWAVVMYKNAVTLTALHGEDIENVDFDKAYTITIWAHVPKQD